MKPAARGWALLFLAALLAPALAASYAQKPNIIFIIADDLGYGDLGCFGQLKIRTPNIDRLAAEGMRFTQHYSGNAVCAPSRCVLMTGKHPGRAFIRDNREVQPEGQLPLPAGTITLPRLLQQAGYMTGAFGKWGLGAPGSTGEPLRQGFNRFFGYNCQRVAHNYYPEQLWDNEHRVTLRNPRFSPHQKLPADADPDKPESYASFSGQDYAPDLIADQARRFIQENRARPFFLFYPTTVPHLALQVPEDSLAEYAGKWPETPYRGGKSYLPHRTPRAAYAAMITRLDREVGSMVQLVKELGLEAQTLFVFTSDNGPLYDQLGGTDTDFFKSADELRGRKGALYEGGFRVPLIVRWKGQIKPGTVSARVTGFEDWLPTIMDLIGIRLENPRGVDGLSFAPTLLGKRQKPRPFLYREFPGYGGQQCIRVGDWKAIRVDLLAKGKAKPASPRTELYDLSKDPTERRDLAQENPEMVKKLEKLMRNQHVNSKEFPFPSLDNPEGL